MPRAAYSSFLNLFSTNRFSARTRLSHDPTGFSTTHPSDTATFKQIGDLSKKDVVPVPKSRMPPDEVFSLAEAYGSHGPQVVDKIRRSGSMSSTHSAIPAPPTKENIRTNSASPTR